MPKKNKKKNNKIQGKKDSRKETNEKNLIQKFRSANKYYYQKQYLEPDMQYHCYILSKDWFKAWKNQKKEKSPLLNDKVNADLLHSNPYKYPKQNLFKGNDIILQNDLEPEVNYILVTKRAWEIVAQNFPCYQIMKRFYLDYDGYFTDLDRKFAVNLIILKKSLTKKLINIEYPASLSNFL